MVRRRLTAIEATAGALSLVLLIVWGLAYVTAFLSGALNRGARILGDACSDAVTALTETAPRAN